MARPGSSAPAWRVHEYDRQVADAIAARPAPPPLMGRPRKAVPLPAPTGCSSSPSRSWQQEGVRVSSHDPSQAAASEPMEVSSEEATESSEEATDEQMDEGD
eukprot:843194-Pelagomonas_calceolata.AAC.1